MKDNIGNVCLFVRKSFKNTDTQINQLIVLDILAPEILLSFSPLSFTSIVSFRFRPKK